MPKVTGLRPERPGRVLVELDGADWRVIPVEVAARAGVWIGLDLDRERLRTLARELRRSRALGLATGALAHRDRSRRGLAERLDRRGVAPAAREEALGALERAGLLDDRRFAHSRARALAERGLGDAAIRDDLERQGIAAAVTGEAIAALEPEDARARRVAAAHGGGMRAARTLLRRGFGPDAVEAAVPAVAQEW
ncbi:MAG: RecX family transcriptional regulator [Gaiellaceae bacterium]